MRIDYKHYPIIKYLHNNTINDIPIYKEDRIPFGMIKKDFISTWNKSINSFRKEINVISASFIDACDKSYKSLSDLHNNAIEEGIELTVKGTYIIGPIVYMADIELPLNDKNNQILYAFTKEGGLIAVQIIYPFPHQGENILWASEYIRSAGVVDKESLIDLIKEMYRTVVTVGMFKSYAQVETKILPPNQKRRDITCLYRNNTDFTVTYLDCKWFTTLVKSEGFNVRGHFRLQPKKKDGKWTRELIWINEFRKHGYTARARILSHNEAI